MLDKVLKLFGRHEPIATAAGLKDFITAQSAFLAQKATIEYCRMRAGLQWQKLFSEAVFLQALERSRWEAFALVLADAILVVEARLRPTAAGRALALSDALARLYGQILDDHPLPEHRSDWNDRKEELAQRLGRAQLAAPGRSEDLAISGRAVFDLLPIHPSMRGHDRLMIFNHLRFGLLAFKETFDRRVDAEAVLRQLLDAQAGP